MTDEEILEAARKDFKRCEDWEGNARNHFIEDLKFGNGDAYNQYQWDENLKVIRQQDQRPMLTINKTQVHCLQIVNDARQNKAGIEVRGVGDEASEEAANILEGIIRHIEYKSNAQAAYDTATYFQVFGGWGYIRVHVDYASSDTFDQDIFIERVPDPLNVYLDPDIQQYDGSDARYGFVFQDLPRKEAEAKYGRYKEAFETPALDGADAWYGENYVRICEYFYKGDKTDTLYLMQDGTTLRRSEMADEPKASLVLKKRDVTEPEVQWCLIIGNTVVEKKPWLGCYIPIARVIGQETVIDGQLDRKGHVRCLIDPQRMYNYNSSGAVEFVALQSKTPYVAAVEAIDGYETQWASANTANHSVLPYNAFDDQGNPVPKPERQQPPNAAAGHLEGMKIAQEEMMMASGQYQAVLGEPSNETSGKAINARQRQGDNATYHFIDHLAQAVRFVGRICLDLIPKVYDTPRVLQVLGKDQTLYKVQIDPQHPVAATTQQDPQADDFDPQQIAAVLNPSVGKYDVISDIGPSYATQRQEAFNAFSQILAQNKEAFTLVGDLWAKAADFPGADELAKRLANMVPMQAKGGPPPEVQQLQQHMQQAAQAGNAQIQMLHDELMKLQQKLADKAADIQRQDYEAETRRLQAVGGIDPEAIKPVIRQLVSEVLQTPIVPIMAQHAAAEQAMQPPPEPAQPQPGA